MIEDTPDNMVIKRKVTPSGLGYAVIALTVCHIQKAEVG